MAVGLKEMIAKARVTVHEIAPAAVREGLDAGQIDLVVDVREPGEWQQGHVPGAVNVPRGLLELKADPHSPVSDPALARREAHVVVYCTKAPSARSLFAADAHADGLHERDGNGVGAERLERGRTARRGAT